MANLRAGLIGLGMMGRHHARNLDNLEGVDLVAVCDPGGDPHKVAGTREVLGSVEELVAAKPDYVTVAVPTVHHEPIALALAEAGIPALIEKPVAQDVAAAERIAKAFADAGVLGAVGHVERYNPALQEARRRIQAGQLGEIYQIVTRRQSPFPGRIADVGVVMDLASHDVDLTAWLAGSPYERISSASAYRSGRSYEDLIVILGRLGNGIIVNHLVNWLTPFKERTTIITGEGGALVADTLMADLTYHANGQHSHEWVDMSLFRGVSEGEVVKYELKKQEPLRTEHQNFRDAVLGKEADIVTLEQGLATIRVCSAAIDAGRSGEVVTLGASGA